MNKNNRRPSKMPDWVRSEIGLYFNSHNKWEKWKLGALFDGDTPMQFIRKGLTELDNHAFLLNCHSVIIIILLCKISHGTPSCVTALERSLDVNQHVNNVSIYWVNSSGNLFRTYWFSSCLMATLAMWWWLRSHWQSWLRSLWIFAQLFWYNWLLRHNQLVSCIFIFFK
jgi:hypothetical protein